ncbi:hypothetical protein QZH41_011486 [Actinostola sp. cb2023]|nr:hypothetical protein QZH41_011486 [Actinostola sp. cb2023]
MPKGNPIGTKSSIEKAKKDTGKHNISDNVPRTLQGKDVNRRAVFACNEVGIGREGLAAICEVLDMPCPVAPNAWAAHNTELHEQHIIAVKEELDKNQGEVKNQHAKDDDDNSVTPISVSFDGAQNISGLAESVWRWEMAAISAVLQFSSGATAKHTVMELAGIPSGSQTADASIRRDGLRVKKRLRKEPLTSTKSTDVLPRG